MSRLRYVRFRGPLRGGGFVIACLGSFFAVANLPPAGLGGFSRLSFDLLLKLPFKFRLAALGLAIARTAAFCTSGAEACACAVAVAAALVGLCCADTVPWSPTSASNKTAKQTSEGAPTRSNLLINVSRVMLSPIRPCRARHSTQTTPAIVEPSTMRTPWLLQNVRQTALSATRSPS